MTVLEIVKEYLKAHGYDGLYCPGECGCLLSEGLAPCGEMGEQCEPGMRMPCDCGNGCDYDVGPRQEVPE